MGRWYLQGVMSDSRTLQEIPLNSLPQVLGRDENLSCTISGPTVSRNHARIEIHAQQLLLTDLGSSNGTFVNRQRILAPTVVDHGDVIHLGSTELRLINRPFEVDTTQSPTNSTRIMRSQTLSGNFPTGLRELEHLIANRTVKIVYQPIIRASDMQCIGYEALCRSSTPLLPTSPLELFKIAESFNLETPLSEMLRAQAIETAEQHNLRGDLLINTHPSEVQNPDRLIGSMVALRKKHPNSAITLEIHEHAMTDDGNLLQTLKEELRKLNIKLAFDDFGVGQSRLMEMIEAKPDLIKFDKKLIDGIDSADSTRIHLIISLITFAQKLNISTLAECVSCEAEYLCCKAMGFDYYQGYHFEIPRPPEFFINPSV